MSITASVYPPIVDNMMPLFINTEPCKIYFDISDYNKFDDIRRNVQILVRNQNNDLTALSKELYPGEVKVCDAQMDNDGYYVVLDPTDMSSGFRLNTYYKVQLRFTETIVNGYYVPKPTKENIKSWLVRYENHFSEWSKICLVRGISQIDLEDDSFTFEVDPNNPQTKILTYNQPILNFYGDIKFTDKLETDRLKVFQIYLYESDYNIDDNNSAEYLQGYRFIEESTPQYVTSEDTGLDINYTFNSLLQNKKYYKLVISIETRGGYKEDFVYRFYAKILYSKEKLGIKELITSVEDSFGRIKISSVTDPASNPYINKFITFFRASSENNFTLWEPVRTMFMIPIIDEGEIGNLRIEKTAEGEYTLYNAADIFAEGDMTVQHIPTPGDDTTTTDEVTHLFPIVNDDGEIIDYEPYYCLVTEDGLQTYYWYDASVESGVFYKYKIQGMETTMENGEIHVKKYTEPIYSKIVEKIIDKKGEEKEIYVDEPIISYFEDMFLTANDMQLRVKHNPKVSSLRQIVSESKTDTIGSKYTFIRRGGKTRYKQFSISGLISFLSDDEIDEYVWDSDRRQLNVINKEISFASDKMLYKYDEIADLYKKYNEEHRITKYNDYIKERKFREKVIEFLYNDDVKLLRTLTEGNVLVKLMDISLTPEQSLGNYVYSFSATAYEVDEPTMLNIFKYNCITIPQRIQDLPELNSILKTYRTEISEGYAAVLGEFILGIDELS